MGNIIPEKPEKPEFSKIGLKSEKRIFPDFKYSESISIVILGSLTKFQVTTINSLEVIATLILA